MPSATPDDALFRSFGRSAVIRSQFASRTWPFLTDLSSIGLGVVVGGLALREHRAECGALFVERS